jgi:hypothetical protein
MFYRLTSLQPTDVNNYPRPELNFFGFFMNKNVQTYYFTFNSPGIYSYSRNYFAESVLNVALSMLRISVEVFIRFKMSSRIGQEVKSKHS